MAHTRQTAHALYLNNLLLSHPMAAAQNGRPSQEVLEAGPSGKMDPPDPVHMTDEGSVIAIPEKEKCPLHIFEKKQDSLLGKQTATKGPTVKGKKMLTRFTLKVGGTRKLHRYSPGIAALQEISHYHKSMDLLIKMIFPPVIVHKLVQQITMTLCFIADSIAPLQKSVKP